MDESNRKAQVRREYQQIQERQQQRKEREAVRDLESLHSVTDTDDEPQLQITSTQPMRCFVNMCNIPINNREPWIIVSAGSGAIFAHMRCLGMNVSGNYSDPAYLAHIRNKLMTGLRDN